METDTTQKKIVVTGRASGYAHVRLWGTCGPDVTREDIEKRFYHSYFGGREARVHKDGTWSCVVHTD